MAINPTSSLIQAITQQAHRAAARPAPPVRPSDPARPAEAPQQAKAPDPARAATAAAKTQKVAQTPPAPNPDLPRGSIIDIVV